MNKISTLLATLVLLVSCNCDFRMVTTVGKDGSVTRSFICPADSALLCGDTTMDMNPEKACLPIRITDEWSLSWNTKTDSEKHHWPMMTEEYCSNKDSLLLTVERRFTSTEEMNTEFQFDIVPVKPHSELTKKFKWFFTEYTFKETFPQPDFTIPYTEYMTREDALSWFTGEPFTEEISPSGSVRFEKLCDIATTAGRWMAANYLAESFQYIEDHYEEIPNTPISKEEFVLEKEHFIEQGVKQIKDFSDWTAQPYEEYFGTDVFQQYIEDNCDTLQSLVWWKYMNFSFCYSVVMPGRAIPSQHSIVTDNVHTYYLNLGMIYAGDYTITAKSRDFNLWAWILSTFLLIFSILCCLPRKK